MRLSGKVAVVSGGGSGIGEATARLFARQGAKVVVTGRRAEPVTRVARETGGRAVPGDVTDPGHAGRVAAAALETFGRLDVLVANAGIGLGGSVTQGDEERWARTIDVNVTGAWRMARAVLPEMIRRGGGSIVVVSSASAFVAATESAAYVTSKAALLGLVRSLAVDYGPAGVRANAVCPGWVITPMGDRAMDELAVERGITRPGAYGLATRHVPLRRPASAEEVAACCLFLASDESSIVTGSALVADGGTTIVDVADPALGPRAPERGA